MSSASDDWKLKICEDEPGVIEIVGNREGLRFLAKVCVSLSDLSDEEAKTVANHHHFPEYAFHAERVRIKRLGTGGCFDGGYDRAEAVFSEGKDC